MGEVLDGLVRQAGKQKPGVTVARVLGDLVDGLGADSATLHRRAANGSGIILASTGIAVGDLGQLPDLADAATACMEVGGSHLGLSALTMGQTQLVLVVQRDRYFTQRELQLIRAVLRGLAAVSGIAPRHAD